MDFGDILRRISETVSDVNNKQKALSDKEIDITGLLKALEAEESKNGINSEKYISMCGLLRDLLEEEDEFVADLKSSPVVVMPNPYLDLDNVCFAALSSIEECIPYRLQRLTAENDPFEEFVSELLNAELLKKINGPSIKYLLAYTNPLLCRDLAAANFNVGMIYPQAQIAELSEEDMHKMTDYLLAKYETTVTVMCDANLGEDHILYDYLSMIDAELPEEEVELLIDDIIDNCIRECNCECAHDKIRAIYNVIVKRRKPKQREINPE